MRIENAKPSEIHQVALAMRHRDFVEFSALSSIGDRAELASSLVERYGGRPQRDVLTVFWDGRPTCIGGAIETRPNVVTLLFFATDNFARVALPLARFIRREIFPRLEAVCVHRFEAVTMWDYADSRKWLEVIGLKQETGPLLNYGRAGETFVQYAKVIRAGQAGA